MDVSHVSRTGAIKSNAGVQGLSCDGVCRQDKPCTPGVISSIAEFVCITFNCNHPEHREVKPAGRQIARIKHSCGRGVTIHGLDFGIPAEMTVFLFFLKHLAN